MDEIRAFLTVTTLKDLEIESKEIDYLTQSLPKSKSLPQTPPQTGYGMRKLGNPMQRPSKGIIVTMKIQYWHPNNWNEYHRYSILLCAKEHHSP